MKKPFLVGWPRLWLVVTSGILLLAVVCIYLFIHVSKKPLIPAVPVVSVCKELAPGMRRIGGRDGLQFDVPANGFTLHEGTSDTPPFTHAFGLIPKNSKSFLEISFGPPLMETMPTDPARIFSTHVEKRDIFREGRTIGEDDWGYLGSGERWRQVRFQGRVMAQYGLVSKKEAELFDRVINSACLLPGPGS